MNHPVIAALAPVVLLVALGYAAGRLRVLRAEAAKDLSNLVFFLLMPALMFRTMGKVDIAHLDPLPLLGYFSAALLLFALMLAYHGLQGLSIVKGAVLGVTVTFSNLVMIGIAFMSLVYGEAGLVVLLSIVSVNALVLLTTGAVVLELAVAHEALRAPQPSGAAQAGRPGRRALGRTVLLAVKNSLLHPVPIPIIAGLFYGQTGWGVPEVIDKPLLWLGNAMGPLALLLVGVTLAGAKAREHLRGALALAMVKNLVLPALVAGFGLLYGVSGLPLVVMVVAASLPAGANAFLFAQRYKVAEDLVTAGITASTLTALLTVPLVMALAVRLG